MLCLGAAWGAQRQVVQDPHYGEVLFHFFQDQYFTAITRLTAAQKQERVPHHRDEAELLRGGMYLSYGLHLEAGRVFAALIDRGAPPAVRDRAWFYLAKIRYQRGYLAEAADAVARVQGRLPAELQDERAVLHSNILIAQKRYPEAIVLLREFRGSPEWAAYGRYNLGVALARIGKLEDAVELLGQVGALRAGSEELQALRDKANVALGFLFLQQEQPSRAKAHLQEVRVSGLMSNKALLGAGWALSSELRYREALTPWLALRGRNVLDSAVQESLLAVPYAFGELGDYKQALAHYEQAIAIYHREHERLAASIQAIRNGRMIENILGQDPGDEMGWFWQMRALPDAPESRYLLLLMAGHDFQEATKNYRDVRFLLHNLDAWAENIGAYELMLANRRAAYHERLPRVLHGLRQADARDFRPRRDALAAELERVAAEDDVYALVTDKERELLARLTRAEATLTRLGPRADLAAAREKYRVLRGVFLWQLNEEFMPRLWAANRELRALDRALEDAARRRAAVDAARETGARGVEGYDERIAQARERIQRLQSELVVAGLQQEQYLQELAVAELERQQQRIGVYITQARFAVAQIYDQAAARGAEPAE
ncbi:MAG TPA: hypothetical protein VGA00_13215 [Acidiferrobacterales bacterium]